MKKLLFLSILFLGACTQATTVNDFTPSDMSEYDVEDHLFYDLTLYDMLRVLDPTSDIHPYTINEEYVNGELEEVIVHDEFEAIIVIGFYQCPWCQAAFPILNEVSLEFDIPVLYIDRRSEENLANPHLDFAVAGVLGHLMHLDPHPETGFPNMWVPEVLHLRGTEVISHHQGTVQGHERVDGELPPLTEYEVDELKNIYRQIFEGVGN